MTYYLLRYPTIYRKLQHEIRSAFKAYDEITASSTTDLEYLHAVALEAMRMYAPLPFALPRVVPEGGDTVDGHFLPAGVSFPKPKRHMEATDGSIPRPSYRLTQQPQVCPRRTSSPRLTSGPSDGSVRRRRRRTAETF